VTRRLSLFPLSTVLYPGLILPLHIFEPRYRGLVQSLIEAPEGSPREFGVVAIRDGHEVGPGSISGIEALHPIGCAAALREVEPYEDGRYDITTVGTRRFRLLSVDTSGALLQAEVEDLDDVDGAGSEELAHLGQAVVRGFARYRAALQGAPEELDDLALSGLEDEDDDLSVTDPSVLSYAVAAAMILETPDKQQLLAAADTATRLRDERRLLTRERGVIRVIPSLPAVDVAQVTVSPN
jgi:Lon protease-like protein